MDASWLPENRVMRRSLIAAMMVYGWTIFGILSSAHFFLGSEASSGGASLEDIAGHVLVFYWVWAAVTPLVLWALRRAVARDVDTRTRWMIIAMGTPAIVLLHGLLYLAAVRAVGVEPMTAIGWPELLDYFMRHAGGDLAIVAVLVAVYLLFDARQRAHARAVAAAALEARLASADLEVLRSQLQPHFLFNALNTVSTLVLKGDTSGADEAIGQISRYLRTALAQRPEATVSVADEIADVQKYFAIERLRFGDTLCLDVRVSDEARRARMPALVLQPLVENAIRHGLAPNARGARIGIRATIEGARLLLRVTDPGQGVPAEHEDATGAEGFGLRYVRERLAIFYGADAVVSLATSPGDASERTTDTSAGGTTARMTIVSVDLPKAIPLLVSA